MSNYLLLRSNKQSGPYTLDQIRAIGLKAYDLIWIEGRSAAWRYPGEVEEFKSFAPMVEEQPYDRFYKRNPVKGQQQIVESKAQTLEKEILSLSSASSSSSYADQNKTPIYSSQPAFEKAIPVREPLLQAGPTRKALEIKDPPSEKKNSSFLPPDSLVESFAIPGAEAVPLEEKFSRPLDDIKKQYVEQLLNRKKNTLQFRQLAIIAAIVFGLILLFSSGIFIGLSINKRGINSTSKDLVKEEPGVGSQQTDYHPRPIPLSTSLPERTSNKEVAENDDYSQFLAEIARKEPIDGEKKKTKATKERDPVLSSIPKNNPVLDSGASIISSEQRQATHRTDAIIAKDAVKNNIADYVIISANKYNVGTFGGISQLQITVSNRSLYPLDLVVAELQYIQTNKRIYKTENIFFRNIGPGSALMQEAPKTPRGVKVQYRITVINSKELGLSYSDM